jgi:hypothetical protein
MGSTTKFLHQKPMAHTGPPRGDARASDSAIRSMTGSSHGPGGQAPVHREKIGDHRTGMHTGSTNSSAVPHISAGRPQRLPRGNGGNDGPDAA